MAVTLEDSTTCYVSLGRRGIGLSFMHRLDVITRLTKEQMVAKISITIGAIEPFAANIWLFSLDVRNWVSKMLQQYNCSFEDSNSRYYVRAPKWS